MDSTTWTSRGQAPAREDRGLVPPACLRFSNEIEAHLILKMGHNDFFLTLGI